MQLIYIGAHPVVDVEEAGRLVLVGVKRGEPVNVPDDLASRLLEQDTWSEAKPAAAPQRPAPVVTPPAPSLPSTSAQAQESDN